MIECNKVLILSDLHFGKSTHNFFEKQLSYFEKVVFPYLLENKIENVIQLGDVFDKRRFSDNKILSELGERFFRFFNKNKINLYIVVGNHDTYNRENANYSPLYQYKSRYITVIKNNKLLTVNNKTFALHSYYCKDFLEADIGCFHHDFIGYKMNKSTVCDNGVELPKHEYKKIYSGHYHGSKDEIYLNTPYQLGFESFGDKNGFVVLDANSLTEEFIENEYSPRFVKVYYYSKDEIVILDGNDETICNYENIIECLGDNFVEFNIEHIDDKMLLDKTLDKMKNIVYTYNNYFKQDNNDDTTVSNDSDIENLKDVNGDILNNYINENMNIKNIDKSKIIDLFKNIYSECKLDRVE